MAARAAAAATADAARSEPPLEVLVARTRACQLQPARFFCAWQGVLTLAFTGFPPQLESLKRALAAHHGGALPAENPGSVWPKSTLGALRDGRRLSPAQLETLHGVCAAASALLPKGGKGGLLAVTELRLTLFACRSLERLVAATPLPLAAPADASPPSPDALAQTAATLAEFDALDTYWVHASRDGGRESHYRDAARGATLVAPLPAAAAAACHLAAFREAVDAALPGMYAWFTDESLHITVRALL